MSNRLSMFSMTSEGYRAPPPGGPYAAQVSATTLLNAVHNTYLSSQPYNLEASTSLVVNTWLTAAQAGPTIDPALAARAWEHARRRAEDGSIILGSLHQSTPSVLVPFLSSFPFAIPSSVFKALEAVRPFIRCVTTHNPSAPRQGALSVSLTLSLTGNFAGASLALSQNGIDTTNGLLNIPKEAGCRGFDVFYYLLTSSSTPAEREFLGLQPASSYTLLARSGSYDTPSYLPTADDAAAADDFRQALKDIGIKGSAHRNLISTLAALLKLGNTIDYDTDPDVLESICEDVGGLLGIDSEILLHKCSTENRETLIGGLYESLVDWIISIANDNIAIQIARIRDGDESLDGNTAQSSTNGIEDTVSLSVIEIPDPTLAKALSMRSVFDDTQGINAEIIQDGLAVSPVGASVQREMEQVVSEVAPDLGITTGDTWRQRQHELEKREMVLEKIAHASDDDAFLKKLLFPIKGEGINLGRAGRFDLPHILASSRVWYHLSIHPTDDSPISLAALPSITSAWSAGSVSRQLRSWRLPEWANRRNRNLDFTADFDVDEFVQRYAALGCKDGKDGIQSWMLERGWSNGEIFIGKERVWIREGAWWEAEGMLDLQPTADTQTIIENPFDTGYSANGSGYFPPPTATDNGLGVGMNHNRTMSQMTNQHPNIAPSIAPTARSHNVMIGDYGLGKKGDVYKGEIYYNEDGEITGMIDPEMAQKIETNEVTFSRRIWIGFVWCMTFWIPSFMLRHIGRMKRPDVRFAWREKIVLVWLIALVNALIIFWIIGFGRLLCPNFDKAYSRKEVATHQGGDDFWVSIHGKIYDISDFWKRQHSDTDVKTTQENMEPLAGLDMSTYFMPPLDLACRGLGITERTRLDFNNTREHILGIHETGFFADRTSALYKPDWYWTNFEPTIKEFLKGDLVWRESQIKNEGKDSQHMWARYGERLYDLTDYFYTQELKPDVKEFEFLNEKVTEIWLNNPGENIKELLDAVIEGSVGNKTENAHILNSWQCIQNVFYQGMTDFRDTPRCTVNNWILLAFTIMLCAVIGIKFLAALQFGSKRRPSAQDKYVICQVPAYTEGEESLRKAIDSLTTLQYDNKKSLICLVCDGVIVGQGNDRPTPKIVLDILGVDPKVDPPALPFQSVGPGSDQLNYGKVYSGLYEFEGNVVPYLVVVKVGKQSEQSKSKPGNRGKRDSQILLMRFLNRVLHGSPMSPLELEMYHQLANVIGVEPEVYEYLLMIDADTSVAEDSLNRLVAACAENAKVAGICGETSLENDDLSWWTMIQVYEYFISHHLSKAFESLFGSVTCLPGCFSMYRLRTADKGKPLIISDKVINDYSICNVDTLHKKNLLSLGEDRFLTTLMMKHFPEMSYKFIPDAKCKTAAPESWTVLLSQRRRWINSTIHNLVELMALEELCGFCCFSMRFVVFIDLTGTIILPATCIYLGYLIYLVATGTGQFPLISIIMLSATYGLQALIFILKREWQHIGWMIIYIISFPIFSFILPIYSFWNQDNFTWGNTRVVVGEKGDKKVIVVDDEPFDPKSIPLQRWDDYAAVNNLPPRRRIGGGSSAADQYEMDEMRSVYSAGPAGSMANFQQRNSFLAPQSTSPYGNNRTSMISGLHFQDGRDPLMQHRQSMLSVGSGINEFQRTQSPYLDYPTAHPSMNNLRSQNNPSPSAIGASTSRLSVGLGYSTGSTTNFDFQRGNAGPDDALIIECIQAVLREVDLDAVTKKQLRALVEQRLQTELAGERRTFMDRQIDRELEKM